MQQTDGYHNWAGRGPGKAFALSYTKVGQMAKVETDSLELKPHHCALVPSVYPKKHGIKYSL